MHGTSDGRRVRARAGRQSADAALVCMASAAVACVLMALAIIVARPGWDTPLLDLPLGAYLVGGIGGLLTTAAAPGWARRLGPHHSARVVVFTLYRLLCSCLMGAMGFALSGAVMKSIGLVAPDGFLYFSALVFGGIERLINMVILGGLGFLAPREINSRLL